MAGKVALIHFDKIPMFEQLDPVRCQKLLLAVLRYSQDNTEPDFSGDDMLRILWSVLRTSIDIDNENYQKTVDRRAESAKKAAAARWGKSDADTDNAENANECERIQTNKNNANDAYTDTDTDTDTDTVSTYVDKDILSGKPDCVNGSPNKMQQEIQEIIDYLNLKAGKKYSTKSEATKKHIKARLNEGYNVGDFFKVIDNKTAQWKGTEWERFLRPQTLFNSEKFDGYLNEESSYPPSIADIRQKAKKHYYDGEEIQRQLLAQFMDDPEEAM